MIIPPFDWITPDWPAPTNVKACVTTRSGGVSGGAYAELNLGDHVGDAPDLVRQNRELVNQALGCQATWLNQVHSCDVVEANSETCTADASFSTRSQLAACVMTADCLPALFCDRQGTVVAAAHAGWRGLLNGVLEATIKSMQVEVDQVLVWLGPAIGPNAFEVGQEVLEAFVAEQSAARAAFKPSHRHGYWYADIYQLARLRLERMEVSAVYGGGFCTVNDPQQRFFSYRQQAVTGRFASLVWLE